MAHDLSYSDQSGQKRQIIYPAHSSNICDYKKKQVQE